MGAPHVPISVKATVWVLAYGVVALEISLTRVFAWIFQHHFAFFAVSLALCGLGVGGYVAYRLPASANAQVERRIWSWSACAVPLTALAATVLSLRIAVDHPGSYLATGALLSAPFLCSGTLAALLFRRYVSGSGSLYAFDLLGASLAAATSVPLLDLWGPLNTILFACLLSSVAPLLLSTPGTTPGPPLRRSLRSEGPSGALRPRRDRRIWWCALPLAFTLLGAANWSTAFLDAPLDAASLSPIRERMQNALRGRAAGSQDPEQAAVTANKSLNWLFLTLALDRGAHLIHTSWDAFARNDVVRQDQLPHVLAIWSDGRSPAYLYRFDGSYEKAAWRQELLQMLPSAPYRLRPIRSVLSVGAGAGLDVHFAKLGGAREVDAVELNPSMKAIVDRFREFGGGVYDQPGVAYHEDEGRSFVRRARRSYDHIVLALTLNEGFSKSTLTESYITTLEAGRDYLEHLAEQGLVSFLTTHERHAQRWLLTCLEVLEAVKHIPVSEALRHLALIQGPRSVIPYDYLVLMSNTPFSEAELDRLKSLAWNAESRSYHGWTYIPQRMVPPEVEALSQGKEWPAARDPESGGAVTFTPATDDSPYFIHMSLEVPAPIAQLLFFALAVAALFALLDRGLARAGAAQPASPWTGYLAWTGYFACLGMGFMLVEIGLIQRFMLVIGSPTHMVALMILALLLGGAAGSRASQWFESGRGLSAWALLMSLGAALATLLVGAGSQPMTSFLLGLPPWVRWISLFLIGVALGALMGGLFPAGLRLLPSSWPRAVPHFWGFNGVVSVIGSVLAFTGGRFIGFRGVLFCGAAAYLLAALFLAGLRPKRTIG